MAWKKVDPAKKKKQKDYNKPKMITLADGSRVMERYHNDRGSKSVFKAEVPDEEESGKKIKDAASRHKYPPPRKNKIFRAKWMEFIDNVTSRDSFKRAHLETLTLLCDMYVEYEELSKILRTQGRTYKTVTRLGEHLKMHPATAHIDKVRANISKYTRLLDLFPKKDKGGGSEGEEEEWK